MKSHWFTLSCACIAPLAPASAAELLPLEQAVELTLLNNFAYRIAALDPEIARESVLAEESAFDSELFASGRLAQSEQSTTFSQTTGTSSDNRGLQAGVRKRLVYGTTVTAQTNLDRRDSNAGVNTSNLSQAADLAVSVRQPLLRGFGREANTASLGRARAGLAATEESVRDTVQATLADAERAYWAVARWQEQLAFNQSSLRVAEALVHEARARADAGAATHIDVLQAEAARAQRIEEIIESNRALDDAIDQLLAIMGTLHGQSNLRLADNLRVTPLPAEAPPVPGFDAVWALAQQADPALARQQAVIAQREWDLVAARNSLRPSLDLVLTGAYIGLDDESARDAYESAFDRDGHAWSVGLEFSMPWGRRGEKAGVRIADRRLEQESIRYEELRQAVFRSVRSAWRALDSVQQSFAAASLTVSLQETSFDREKEKYAQGLSAFRDVLQAQSDLDQARIRLLQSKYNRLAAEIALARLSGGLFQRHGLSPQLPRPG